MSALTKKFTRLVDLSTPQLVGLSILLSASLTVVVRFKVIYLAHPDVGGVENNVIYSILRLLGGHSLYENPAAAPYAITQYSPIYYHLVAGVAKLTRLSPDDVYGVYSLSRQLSLAANLLFLGGVAQLARRLRLPAYLIVAVVLLIFAWIPPQSYGRPDSLSNALVVWTIYAMIQWFTAGTARWWQGAVPTAGLTALALFTKQSAIFLPVLVAGYGLVVARDWRRVGAYCGLLLLFLGVNYVIWIEEAGAVVWANVVKGISNGIDLANFKTNLIDHYLIPYSVLVILALLISYRHWLGHDSNRRVLGVSLIGLFLFACATGLKQGAALNYFTEFTALAVLVVADAGWQWRQAQPTWPLWANLAFLLGGGLMVPVNAANFNWKRVLGKSSESSLYQQDQAVARYLADSLALAPSDQVYNTGHNTNFLNTLLFQNCILPQQEIVRDAAYPRRTFDYTALDASVRFGQVRYIITPVSDKQLPLPSLRLTAYQPVKTVGGYVIYKADPRYTALLQNKRKNL